MSQYKIYKTAELSKLILQLVLNIWCEAVFFCATIFHPFYVLQDAESAEG